MKGVIDINKYYVAYGSNLDINDMGYRCPNALPYKVGRIDHYKLVFRGNLATIEPDKKSYVPVLVWKITNSDECNLDYYEGYPHLYYKKTVKVHCNDGINILGLVYIMADNYDKSATSVRYNNTIKQGYKNCGFDLGILEKAIKEANE